MKRSLFYQPQIIQKLIMALYKKKAKCEIRFFFQAQKPHFFGKNHTLVPTRVC